MDSNGDILSFFIFSFVYAVLSVKKTINEYKNNEAKKKNDLKKLINYCLTLNSSFLFVGSLSESYLFGARMMGNILSVTLGFIYAFFIVHPVMYCLEADITTPYQYFERRYKSKLIRSLSAIVSMFFYFSFLTLYLWGCTVLLSTLLPTIPFWVSSLIIGTYSVLGSTIGGFTQTTLTNLVQFIILVGGLITAVLFTITESKNSPYELWNFASKYDRTNFFELSTKLTVRYTILNQLVSLPIPWCTIHALLLPNFIRYRSIKGRLKSRFLMVANFPNMLIVYTLLLMSGSILCFLYFFGCDPLTTNSISNKNQTGVYWLKLLLSKYMPSLAGMLFSSILFYSVVQHSIGIALCGNTLFDDVIRPLIPCVNFNLHTIKWIKLIIILVLGALSILYAISFRYAKNTMLSLFFLFNNTTNSPILGLFLLSAFNPYANSYGAITGFIINLLINYWLGAGSLLFSKLVNEEYKAYNNLCNANQNRTLDYENFNFNSSLNYFLENYTKSKNQTIFYYPENKVIFYLYSIAPIWYCLPSVLLTFSLGSLFSLIFSLIFSRSLDSDSYFKEERKKYLFYYKAKDFLKSEFIIEEETRF